MAANKLFTSDILIVDRVIDLRREDLTDTQKQAMRDLAAQYGMTPGSKRSINKEEFTAFKDVLLEQGINSVDVAGGSSANTAVTLQKTVGPDKIDATFLGVVGATPQDMLISDGLKDAGIKRIPQQYGDIAPESAVSLVVVDEMDMPDGTKKAERAIVTYAGNAKTILKSADMTDKIFAEYGKNDAVLVQGSLWYKYGNTRPEAGWKTQDLSTLGVADRILRERRDHGSELWLTMPTVSDYSKGITDTYGNAVEVTHEQRAKHFQDLIRDANVVLGNGEEISRVYTTKEEREEIEGIIEKAGGARKKRSGTEPEESVEDYLARIRDAANANQLAKYDFLNMSIKNEYEIHHNKGGALLRLQQALDAKQLANDSNWQGNTSQIAFVTLGREGAAVIHDGVIEKVPAAPFDDKNIVNTLGAGDASYAGFLAAYQMRKEHAEITHKDCATMGMWMAREKLQYSGARVVNPYAAVVTALRAAQGKEGEDQEFVKRLLNVVDFKIEAVGPYQNWESRARQMHERDPSSAPTYNVHGF